MDRRYQHPAVERLWSPEWTYAAWWKIEQAIIRAQRNHMPEVNGPETDALLSDKEPRFSDPDVLAMIGEMEKATKHDVAAFVNYMREWFGTTSGRWIHYGVTSSDLVDTAQGMRFKELQSTSELVQYQLVQALHLWTQKPTVVLGMTHGQPAEPTSMQVRASHWHVLLTDALTDLTAGTNLMMRAKIAGPVGTYAHNPPQVEADVAFELGLVSQTYGSSQVIPRGYLARWASAAAHVMQVCAKIAMDLRLMNLLREAGEPLDDGQVGSSSMAHKVNPIRAEQITGLARVGLAYSDMLQPLDLWLERDISHSSVERIAVPDLWHLVLHVMGQTTRLLERTELVGLIVEKNLEDSANAAYVSHATYGNIRDGMDAEAARKYGNLIDIESYDLMYDMRRDFLKNYPWKVAGS